jgi:hypothetical protein
MRAFDRDSASDTDVGLLVMNEGRMWHILSGKFTIGGEATAAAGLVGRDATRWISQRALRGRIRSSQDPGKLGDPDPEPLDYFHDGRQCIAAARLRNVPVGVIIIRSLDIFVSFGGRKHEHRNFSELPVLLDPPKYFGARHSRQVPIEKYKIRERGAFLLDLEQEMESLLAVFCGRQMPAGWLSTSVKSILNQI